MKNCADQERMARLLPMIAPLERTLRVNQDVGDVLGVPHLGVATANFQQRIIWGRSRIGRVEQEHPAEPGAPSGGELPVLALDVMDDRRTGPGQERRDDQSYPLPGAGRGEAEHVLRRVMTQIFAREAAEHDTIWTEETRETNLSPRRPSGRTVGRDRFGLPGAPNR